MSSGIRTLAEVVGVGPLREMLADCVARSREIELRAFDRASRKDVARSLLPRVEDVLRRTVTTLRAANGIYEDANRGMLADVDALHADARRAVADIAFFGIADLGARLDGLHAVRDADADELRDACRGARRRALRVLTALDAALATAHGLLPRAGLGDELSDAIVTRRQYAALRRAICEGGEPSDAVELRARLAVTQQAMRAIMASDVYAVLRLADRRQIEALSARIDVALDGGAELSLRRLHQDLVGFADLVAQVSRREELVQNDARVLREALAVIESGGKADAWLRARLVSMEGLDEEADALILAGDFAGTAWARCVARLHDRIVRPVRAARRAVGVAS